MKKLFLLLLFPLICFGQTNPNIYIQQAGDGNSFTVTQDYTGNYASIVSGSQSPADYNVFSITQQGTGQLNASIELLSGYSNNIAINQQGSGNNSATIQGLSGASNTINVGQSGAANNNFSLTATAGTLNSGDTISATQYGNAGADKSFNLTLSGSSGATVTIIQDNPSTANSGSMVISCIVCGSYSYIRH